MIDQERATHAAGQVNKVPPGMLNGYEALAAKLPAMLMTVGLGQTIAFLRSKDNPESKENEHRVMVGSLRDWLTHTSAPVAWADSEPSQTGAAFQARLASCSTAVYYQALDEAVRYAGWLKRLAKARVNDDLRRAATQAGSTHG